MCIFQFSSQVWRWAQEHNCFIHGQADSLQIGLHDGKMSLWLDDNIERGRSEVNSQWDSGKLPGLCASLIIKAAAMAEWLRRWTWNPMGSSRTGSNPVRSDKSGNIFPLFFEKSLFSSTDLLCFHIGLDPSILCLCAFSSLSTSLQTWAWSTRC